MNIFPKLVVSDAARAIDFYTEALGAKETERFAGPDGTLVHVGMALGDARFTLKDEDSADSGPLALGLDGSPVILMVEVPDADTTGARLEAGGATVVYPIDDHGYGRMGRFRDPFGHVWIVSQTSGA